MYDNPLGEVGFLPWNENEQRPPSLPTRHATAMTAGGFNRIFRCLIWHLKTVWHLLGFQTDGSVLSKKHLPYGMFPRFSIDIAKHAYERPKIASRARILQKCKLTFLVWINFAPLLFPEKVTNHKNKSRKSKENCTCTNLIPALSFRRILM